MDSICEISIFTLILKIKCENTIKMIKSYFDFWGLLWQNAEESGALKPNLK